jgi:hypothetical protein
MVQAWGEDNEWGTRQGEEEVETIADRRQLPTEQGSSSVETQVLSHGFSASTSVANQEGAGGDITPAVGTDESTNDAHRSHSSDDDSVCSMGLILGQQRREDISRKPDCRPGPDVLGVTTTPCKYCQEAHSWVDCPTPHILCYEPQLCKVPCWHPYRGLFCGAPLIVFNEEGEPVSFTLGGTRA